MWSITLPTECNSRTVKHTAGGITLHQNIFGVRFDPICPDVLVNVSGLMRVKMVMIYRDSFMRLIYRPTDTHIVETFISKL